jgi:citronellol/citronellal dehydrogenase
LRLEGRVAFITGASRGIGRSIALKLASEGAAVVVAAKTADADPRLPGTIHTVAEEIRAQGGRALPFQLDVRDAEAIDAAVGKAVAEFGHVDILVNNAGALYWRPVVETPAKKFDLVMQVNARAAFLCAHAVLPSMIQRRWGHIINMSPAVNLERLPGHVAYFISKLGMTMLSHGLAKEVEKDNIAVNSLWPVTIIESQASINFHLGDESLWRTAEIMADAVAEICAAPPSLRSGRSLSDEEVLREAGITDFSRYQKVPGKEPPPLARIAPPLA